MLGKEEIRPEYLGLALNEAAGGGHIDVVRLLLHYPRILEEDKISAFISAIIFGHKSVINFLLEKGGILRGDQLEALDQAVDGAARELNQERIVALLLKSRGFSQAMLSRLAKIARDNGRENIERLLIREVPARNVYLFGF